MYSKVMDVYYKRWQIGKIENYTARPLEESEIENICTIMNHVSKADTDRAKDKEEIARLIGQTNEILFWALTPGTDLIKIANIAREAVEGK